MGEALLATDAAAPPARNRVLSVRQLGVVPYPEAAAEQRRLVALRQRGEVEDTLLLLEHQPVFTVGRDGRDDNVRIPRRALQDLRIDYHEVDRGGDITYHGPGQLVVYPIFDLRGHRRDVRWYVSGIERCLVRALARFDLEATVEEGLRGVWVGRRKIAAIGIHVSRWVTSHGFALNVDNDLRPFDYIVPCGIEDRGVTSMAVELGPSRLPDLALVRAAVALSIREEFGFHAVH